MRSRMQNMSTDAMMATASICIPSKPVELRSAVVYPHMTLNNANVARMGLFTHQVRSTRAVLKPIDQSIIWIKCAHRRDVYEVQAPVLVVDHRSVLVRAARVRQHDIARGPVLAQHVVRLAVDGHRVVLPLAGVDLQGLPWLQSQTSFPSAVRDQRARNVTHGCVVRLRPV